MRNVVLHLLLLVPALTAVVPCLAQKRTAHTRTSGHHVDVLARPPRGVASVDTLRIYQVNDVERRPEFPGGDSALFAYVNEQFNYPELPDSEQVGGKVYVELVVHRDGSVDQVRVRRGLVKPLNDEAERVVRGMPPWIPARYYGGVVVACRMTLPIVCVVREADR